MEPTSSAGAGMRDAPTQAVVELRDLLRRDPSVERARGALDEVERHMHSAPQTR